MLNFLKTAGMLLGAWTVLAMVGGMISTPSYEPPHALPAPAMSQTYSYAPPPAYYLPPPAPYVPRYTTPSTYSSTNCTSLGCESTSGNVHCSSSWAGGVYTSSCH